MKENIKFQILKIVIVLIVVLLIYGACTREKPINTDKIYKEETFNTKSIDSEYYSEKQLAFIYWEDMYKYFINVEEAERCKEEISNYLLQEEGLTKVWVVQDVQVANSTLQFKLLNHPKIYQVKINENNMIVYKVE